jgi:diguanylate cyclase (GGDEF)-like protein
MRKRFSFSSILDLCLRLMRMTGGFVVFALVCGVVGMIGWDPVWTGHRMMHWTALVSGFVALGLLFHSYYAMRRALLKADGEKRTALEMANRDALTGTFTRSYFFELLRQSVHHGSDTPVGYMQVDMDHLKSMNDGNGHAAGDAALVHLIKTISELAPSAIIGRMGGDEFGIALSGIDNKQALRRLGEQILLKLGEPVHIGGRMARLSATIGVAVAPEDGGSADELIFKADLALYKGKRAGRNLAVSFDPDMLGDERHKRFVERELRAAILLNELDLHYQPIFAADGVTLRSYESLCRWRHPVRGAIPPSDFIPIAEQSDLIDKLGEWVLRRACSDLAALGAPAIGVNVSAAQLRRPEFAERFADILLESGVSGRQLIVEVTETVPLQAGASELKNLDALRAMGVRVAIDDFGAGHASLQYLRGFAFDIIKIDKTYVDNLGSGNIDAMIISSICRIAEVIGADVVAEGVETREQMEALQAAGCGALQGYYLGRPAPVSAWVKAGLVAA